MSGAMCLMRMPAPKKGGQRLIQRRRACELLVPPRSCRRTLPLFIRDLCSQFSLGKSRLRRDGQAAAVDGLEDFVSAAVEQGFADCVAERFRIVEIAIARFAQELRAIGIGDDCVEMESAPANFRKCANGDLAASAEAVE